MQFLFPGFLWVLGLLSVPVIIHLFYFRRYKKVLFTQVRFLRELVEQTAHRNKLRNLLILLCRMIALAALILAFAQPFLPDQQGTAGMQKAVAVFIDNSHSMNGQSDQGSLFAKAKALATGIVEAHGEYDKIAILSHELGGRQNRFLSREDALTAIEEIRETAVVSPLSKVCSRIQPLFSKMEGYQPEVYLISDFQTSITDLTPEQLDSSIRYHLVPVQSLAESNVSIDSAWFVQPVVVPGQVNAIAFTLTNHGDSEIDQLRVSYSLNGQEFPHGSVDVPPGKQLTDTIRVKIPNTGEQQIAIRIKDYPITFDDEYFLSARVDEAFGVQIIYEQTVPKNLDLAVGSIPYFSPSLSPAGALDYSKFASNKLIILTGLSQISSGLSAELEKVIQAGTNVLLFPAAELKPGAYDVFCNQLGIPAPGAWETLRKEVGRIDLEGEVFSDVFINPKANIKLPVSTGQYQLSRGAAFETIMSYRDGSPFLVKYLVQKGNLFVFACPWGESYSNLARSPEVLLPFLFKAAVSNQASKRHSYTIGRDLSVSWTPRPDWVSPEAGLLMTGPEEFVPSLRPQGREWQVDVYEQVRKPGIYSLSDRKEQLAGFAFNEDRTESDPSFLTAPQIREKLGERVDIVEAGDSASLAGVLKANRDKKSYWWILVLASVIFLFLESLLIRLWKN